MATPLKKPRQFRLRSLLACMTWFALILAVCVNHQHAATKHRQTLEALRSAGMLPAAHFLIQRQPAKPAHTAQHSQP